MSMHIGYAPGRLHADTPISDPRATQLIADAETLFEAGTRRRWPDHAVVQIGDTAVLRCTLKAAAGRFPYSEVLIDVSLDRLQEHPVTESHVLFQASLKSERAAQIIHSGVVRVQNVAWIVKVFSPGEWVKTLADTAREALPTS